MNDRVIPFRSAPADRACAPLPRLLIDKANPNRTVATLRDIFAGQPSLYQRGGPVRLVQDELQGGVVARMLTPETVIRLAHDVSRPYAIKHKGGEDFEVDVQLPRSIAAMYLDMHGELKLRPLNGIVSSPLLQDDGSITVGQEYDTLKGLWCDDVPDMAGLMPDRPTRQEAERALRIIRHAFRTFCFADASTIYDVDLRVNVVDQTSVPGCDESTLLTAFLTAVARPSLDFAPGFMFRASPLSGAGTGKGLLARCVCAVAFGRKPHAVTSGRNADELDKRIAAELLQGGPVMFLDNLNNTVIKNDLLASAITEKPARVRPLGRSDMMPINTICFVVVTGNGVRVSEDLARRFLTVELDAKTEDPESREFKGDILATFTKRRHELLAAALMILRRGLQTDDLPRGKPLGGFDTWASWVRDPLLALGCQDAVARIGETKQRDGLRAVIGEILATWHARHRDRAIKLRDLHEDVVRLVDPRNRSRQFLSHRLETLVGTRAGGYVLTRQSPLGRHGVATYTVEVTDEGEPHRGHRGHPEGQTPPETAESLISKSDGGVGAPDDLAAAAGGDTARPNPVEPAALRDVGVGRKAPDDPDGCADHIDDAERRRDVELEMDPMTPMPSGITEHTQDFDWEVKP